MEILEALLWVLMDVFGGVLFDVAFGDRETYKEALRRENRRPLVAMLGYLLLGGVIGAMWVWLVPERIFVSRTLPGASLVLAPLLAGVAMAIWGQYRRAGGHVTTQFATWYGGAGFGLGLAYARYLGTQ